MVTRVARCACGRLNVSCRGDPVLVSLCHCLECQRRTGSTYGVAAFFARENVVMNGPAQRYNRTGDSGRLVTFYFCPHCGSTVWWERQHKPDLVVIAVGAFADPAFPAPSKAVYEDRRYPWVGVLNGNPSTDA